MLADKAFHVRISQQAGNPFLTALQVNVFDLIIFTRALEGFPLSRMEEAIAEHDAIVEARGGSDAARVRRDGGRRVEKGAPAIVDSLVGPGAGEPGGGWGGCVGRGQRLHKKLYYLI